MWLEWSGPRIDRGCVARVVWAKDRPGGWLEGSGPRMDQGCVARGVWAMDGPWGCG